MHWVMVNLLVTSVHSRPRIRSLAEISRYLMLIREGSVVTHILVHTHSEMCVCTYFDRTVTIDSEIIADNARVNTYVQCCVPIPLP